MIDIELPDLGAGLLPHQMGNFMEYMQRPRAYLRSARRASPRSDDGHPLGRPAAFVRIFPWSAVALFSRSLEAVETPEDP